MKGRKEGRKKTTQKRVNEGTGRDRYHKVVSHVAEEGVIGRDAAAAESRTRDGEKEGFHGCTGRC